MSLIQQAKKAMLDLAELTSGFSRGAPPDPHSVLAYQSELVRLYALIGEDMSRTFGLKEMAYLSRKIEQAKQHTKGRVDLRMTSKDSEERAFREVKGLYEQEIQAMESFELHRVFLKSLQAAIDHSRQVVSFLGKQEKNSDQ